jgi:hypothetical protein
MQCTVSAVVFLPLVSPKTIIPFERAFKTHETHYIYFCCIETRKHMTVPAVSAAGASLLSSLSNMIIPLGRAFKTQNSLNSFRCNKTLNYTIVTAVTAAGASLPSSLSNMIIPSGVPSKPIMSSLLPGNGAVLVHFTPPRVPSNANTNNVVGDGGSLILSYTVTATPGGKTATGVSPPLLIKGLTNGIAYTFTVAATNKNGIGSSSTPSPPVTPRADVPGK